MAIDSFKSVEKQEKLTLLNFMTTARAVGGVALGIGMARYNLDPGITLAGVAVLAASDAEGNVLNATKRYPKLQKALRIIPSTFGRIFDPIADKIFTTSVLIGGIANESIPKSHAIGILAAELAIVAVATNNTRQGIVPEVSTAGKAGMVARSTVIGLDLAAASIDHAGNFHEALQYAGHATAVAAVALGGLSAYKLSQAN